jgi:hypothetical protein
VSFGICGVLARIPACIRPSQGDINSDHVIDVFDVIYLIDFTFRAGPNPVDPCEP